MRERHAGSKAVVAGQEVCSTVESCPADRFIRSKGPRGCWREPALPPFNEIRWARQPLCGRDTDASYKLQKICAASKRWGGGMTGRYVTTDMWFYDKA